MWFRSLRPWALAACVGVASPTPAAVVSYDDQGAFLGVTEDAYVGGKWSVVSASSSSVSDDSAALLAPAINPNVFIALAVVIALILISSDGDGDSSGSSSTGAGSTPVPPAAPLPPSAAPAPPSAAPAPTPPVTAVPVPLPIGFLLSGLFGLLYVGRRKP